MMPLETTKQISELKLLLDTINAINTYHESFIKMNYGEVGDEEWMLSILETKYSLESELKRSVKNYLPEKI